MLRAHDSNAEAPGELPSAELIAQASMEAARAGQFYNSNQNVSDTVEFWMRRFAEHLNREHLRWQKRGAGEDSKFSDAVDPFAQRYPRWSIAMLLDHACYKHLAALCPHIKTMVGLVPELMTELSKVVLQVAEFNIEADTPLDVAELPISKHHRLFKSALYTDFMKARWSRRFELLRSNSDALGVEARYQKAGARRKEDGAERREQEGRRKEGRNNIH